EGTKYENNSESLFEVQFLDNGMQGTDDEWTPVNTSANATQGHALESNYAAGSFGGWADISGSTWLYNLFKAEKTKDGKLDPRVYWTLGTYETDWTESYPAGGYGNVYYTNPVTAESNIVTNNNNGGIPIVKNTNARTGVLSAVVTGLKCGINLRIIRLADIYLLAAEAINEVSGPNQTAIDYINVVRRRANLNDLQLGDFSSADALFEQIANVERPKELGCEFGRGFDLIRWGWFYNDGRMAQLKQHGAVKLTTDLYTEYPVISPDKTSFDNYRAGHEYIPYYQGTLNDNPNLGEGNSANTSTANTPDFNVRNVVSGIGL
ncbi:MAG: RagB/SusD family nutrient uptake outer membrane protein, partial [Bacteroidales bacterium]|nr:RagB/SusD family nutrient uptake outer membrane protein [Bacteroidales bacterium]